MQVPLCHLSASLSVPARPTVGALMAMCEENYQRLLRLVPQLKCMRGTLRSRSITGLDLYLEVIDQAPYTTLLHLTHYFPHRDQRVHRLPEPDPDVLLRAYHDSQQVEVLDLRQTILPVQNRYEYPALESKWRVNLFLSKWLAYCAVLEHGFVSSAEHPGIEAGDLLAEY